MAIRTFIALAIPPNQVQSIADIADELKCNVNYYNFKWSKPYNYHLTMRFLGDLEESVIEEIDQQLCN